MAKRPHSTQEGEKPIMSWPQQKSTLNLPLAYVYRLFDGAKDASGKPMDMLDAQSFLGLLQTAATQRDGHHAKMLGQLVAMDITQAQQMAGMSMTMPGGGLMPGLLSSPQVNPHQPQSPQPVIASLDGDGSSYSKQDFQLLAQMDSAMAAQQPQGRLDRIENRDIQAAQIIQMIKQSQQSTEQLMSTIQKDMQSLTSINGLSGQSDADSTSIM
jgi:hypothetical protein